MTLKLNYKLVVSFALVGVLASTATVRADGDVVSGVKAAGKWFGRVGKTMAGKDQNKCEQPKEQTFAPPPAKGSCDADRFITATGCAGDSSLWSRTFLGKLRGGDYNYCKQYNNTPFAVLTQGDDGNVVVINKSSCTKVTYKADRSGIDQMKVVGGFVYFTSNDGQLYIVDARGRIFEIQSNSGKSYSRANNSAVLDIKGDGSDPKILHVTNQSGKFVLTAGKIQSDSNRYELLATTGEGGRFAPPPALEEETQLAGAALEDSTQDAPPPPGGYRDNDWGPARDITAPTYWFQAAYGSLGDCDGSISVERVNGSTVDVSFRANLCSRVEFDKIDSERVDETKKLDTSYKPYTGSYRVYGSPYVGRNKAKITLRSRSGATGVVYYIHF